MERPGLRAFKAQRGQDSALIGARIDADPVGSPFDFVAHRMPVDDRLREW